MKKELFIIKPHSIVDVITNSSSELFIIDEESSVEMVKEILQEMLYAIKKIYNIRNIECKKNELDFNKVFGGIKIIKNWKDFKDFVLNFPEDYCWDFEDIHNKTMLFFNIPSDAWDNLCKDKQQEKIIEFLDSHKYEYEDKYLNKMIILSKSENSIPSEICEFIEKHFYAERIHLG